MDDITERTPVEDPFPGLVVRSTTPSTLWKPVFWVIGMSPFLSQMINVMEPMNNNTNFMYPPPPVAP